MNKVGLDTIPSVAIIWIRDHFALSFILLPPFEANGDHCGCTCPEKKLPQIEAHEIRMPKLTDERRQVMNFHREGFDDG